MHWVLLIMMMNLEYGYPSVGAAKLPFETKEMCEAAGKIDSKNVPSGFVEVYFNCEPTYYDE